MSTIIDLLNISKSYGDNIVLDNINISLRKNEFLTLLGPSGCGKTTTLRIIGGFENPDVGKVVFEGKDITHIPPYKRNLNTVFQKYALFSHLNVFDNIAFGLKIKKMSKKEITVKVNSVLELINLKGFENRSIDSLSGGQQQRIAIARALANEPNVLLLDEPLGALDLKLRKDMQYELKRIQQELGITFIYVTHDQEEALTMSDTVVVMNNGLVQQVGTPENIYNEPANAFVADFIGESNLIDGIMLEDCLVKFLDKNIPCVDKGFATHEPVDVVIRPEDVEIAEIDTGLFNGVVTSSIFKGVHYEMNIQSRGYNWTVHNTKTYEIGSKVGINVIPFNIHIMKKLVEG
ncbi:spermidine/putrescine ABC transporter ATP-binding protein [Vallitalea longa]|uniref:Spermidine/putrescine import ATP-binding protein PotA n=1 Tax=Vallitalea longa TaxID=2936439 RepID=A0A9W6DFW4_9FIRM|nr:spermidine/putrescine ABC transporter ATP-binding protein [Vallitalea longa]